MTKVPALLVGLFMGVGCGGVADDGPPTSATFASFEVKYASPDSGEETMCMPVHLRVLVDCQAACVGLVEYPGQVDQAAGCTDPGMSQPDVATLAAFQRDFLASMNGDPMPVVCVYQQLTGGASSSLAQGGMCTSTRSDYQGASCASDPNAPPGWCYVVGVGNGGACEQTIAFSQGGPPAQTILSFTCEVTR